MYDCVPGSRHWIRQVLKSRPVDYVRTATGAFYHSVNINLNAVTQRFVKHAGLRLPVHDSTPDDSELQLSISYSIDQPPAQHGERLGRAKIARPVFMGH